MKQTNKYYETENYKLTKDDKFKIVVLTLLTLLLISHFALWYKIGKQDKINEDHLSIIEGLVNNQIDILEAINIHGDMFKHIYYNLQNETNK